MHSTVSLGAGLLTGLALALGAPFAGAASLVESGLEAAYAFSNDSGPSVIDQFGSNNATVYGQFGWEGESLHLVGQSGDFGWTSIPRGSLMSGDWTVDLWFSALNNGESGAGRVLSASTRVGGTGPEWFFRSGKIAMRINNDSATWSTPRVGSRSNSGPPDHWALPTNGIPFNSLVHYVVTHDAAARTVRMYQASGSETDLQLVFDGDYTGSYAITVADLRLSHSHDNSKPRYLDAHHHQILFYDRVLAEAEVQENHDAGPESLSAASDDDQDGVSDDSDNCLLVANPDQIDADNDGFGNRCDADLNNDCSTDFEDLGAMKLVFFSADPVADLNGDGAVNFADVGLLKARFLTVPGPSGLPNGCDNG